ncbi:Ser/Thr protein kinase RdoA (MazF antagonist) [Paenibacillus forsythiae]|uniref:Ser/Thr protein kinase RdoA (MazF antagonist) n=1 Tax=Paenibacillus forsythiae TaxID=365616 RepID=A0ABU3HDL9_9BACL|nr:phosphotransferase [Paenibacillus forsythiae]MDT3427770.1 Ser/Thr protein kinase RdoA (MazF antagonist) [Paenibacillus forsythiae]
MNISDKILDQLTALYGTCRAALNSLGHGLCGVAFTFIQNGTTKVLKCTVPPSRDPDTVECFRERLAFVNFLGERQVPVARINCSLHGNLVEFIHEDQQIYIAYCMELIEGKGFYAVNEMELDDYITQWGKSLGQLHRWSKEYASWREVKVSQATGTPIFGWLKEWSYFYRMSKDDGIQECWRDINRQFSSLPLDRQSYGFIHNDPSKLNVLYARNKGIFIDFDVANYHWYMADIAIALYSILYPDHRNYEGAAMKKDQAQRSVSQFLRAYNQENAIDEFWLKQLNVFLSYRRILLFTAMYQSLLPNPDNFHAIRDRILRQSPIADL